MPNSAWLPLALFMALVLAASLQGLSASGHFPSEHRAPALRSPAGTAILFGSSVLALVALLMGLIKVWTSVPWYAAVIGGGLMMLVAPLLLSPLPDRFVNGCGALALFSTARILLALALLWAV